MSTMARWSVERQQSSGLKVKGLNRLTFRNSYAIKKIPLKLNNKSPYREQRATAIPGEEVVKMYHTDAGDNNFLSK